MQILKKGVYQFVEIPTMPSLELYQNLTFISGSYKAMYLTNRKIYYIRNDGYEFTAWDAARAENAKWRSPHNDDTTSARLIMIDADQEVQDDFYSWFVGNTIKAAASIKYRDAVVSTMFTGERAELACAGAKMLSNLIIETADAFQENLDLELDEQISLLNQMKRVLLSKLSKDDE